MFDELKAPFPPEKISWRVGATNKNKTQGLALAYIDARDVMERLDAAVGPGNWQDTYSHVKPCVCSIGIKIDDEWVWKSNGAGETDVEAEKGALSDAFKRAGVMWGIGRYLYDIKSVWVAIESAGRSSKIKQSEYSKLAACLTDGVAQEPKKELSPAQAKFREIKIDLLAAPDEETIQYIWAGSEVHRKALPEAGQEQLVQIYKDARSRVNQAA